MSDYDVYQGREDFFGIAYPAEGDLGSPHDEQIKTESIGRLIQAMLDALGEGIYSGGRAELSGLDCLIPALKGVIADALGAVPIAHEEEIVEVGEFAEGVNYVHLQLAETARQDGDCGFYVSASETPADDALRVCKVTVSAGAITEIDNTVQEPPAIASRIPFETLLRSYADETTLLELLTATLGTAYLGETLPDDIDSRLTTLEESGGGGGGGGVITYWGVLLEKADNTTTIRQAAMQIADDAVAAHVQAYHGGGGGDGGGGDGGGDSEITVMEPWNVDAVNQLRLLIQGTHWLPTLPETQIDAVIIVRDIYGDGSHGTVDFVDHENSTWD
jgi:hypothetical protein